MTLTPKQYDLLQFITQYQKDKGFAPSQKEIAEHFGFSSLGTVQNYLKRLEAQGYLSKSWNGKRALQVESSVLAKNQKKNERALDRLNVLNIPERGASQPQNPSPLLSQRGQKVSRLFGPTSNSFSLPLVGSVAAGVPIEAIEQKEELNLADIVFRGAGVGRPHGQGDFVALKVRGDSMIDEGIFDGDYVVIHKVKQPKNGDVVVALLDNEATLKRLQRRSDQVELHPANGKYQPLVISNEEALERGFSIEGVLTAVIRAVR